MWFVYVVRCADKTLYTGITTDVKRRLAEHNDGCGARYTRSRGPVELVYKQRVKDRGAALRREYQIKRLALEDKQKLIAKKTRRKRAVAVG